MIKNLELYKVYEYLSKEIILLDDFLSEYNDDINHIFQDINKCHTLLSYSIKKRNINKKFVKRLLLYGADLNIRLEYYNSPLFYLLIYHELDIVKEILQTVKINMSNVFNFYYIMYNLIGYDDYQKWQYIMNNDYKLLLSETTIRLFCRNKPDKKIWLQKECIEIYYTLILMNKSKHSHTFTFIPIELIKKIFRMIFI